MNIKKELKVGIVSHSDFIGGADRAAYRLHRSLKKGSINSTMFVDHSSTNDESVCVPGKKLSRFIKTLRPRLARLPDPLYKGSNSNKLSASFISSGWPRYLNSSDSDIIHLHWPHNEMMSISDISKIKKPLVWTLHDMWAFCGAEHYSKDRRFIEGYSKSNRGSNEAGLDLNRWTWNRKLKHWKNEINIIAPSNWMANMAKSSKLMNEWPVHVIPNTIDLEFWKPIEKSTARSIIGIPEKRNILLFCAFGGRSNPIKGFDLLEKVLSELSTSTLNPLLVIIGERGEEGQKIQGLDTKFLGHLYDDYSLKLAYSSADAVLLPSRLENLPNVAVESISCGTPVIAFDTSGVPDVIKHNKNGWLAEKFDVKSFYNGIKWALKGEDQKKILSLAARSHAVENFNSEKIVQMHLDLYHRIVQD